MDLYQSVKTIAKKLLGELSAFTINYKLFRIKNKSLRSNNQKYVVSFCLFGTDEKYLSNLDACIKSYQSFFPDWIVRIYVSADLPKNVLQKIKSEKCELITMNCNGLDYRYTFWRFLALDDRQVAYAMVRDIDSIASEREKVMVEQWIQSKKTLHVIRDHPDHTDRIMGGLFGSCFDESFDIKKSMLAFKKFNKLGIDQQYLNQLYSHYSKDMFVHDIFQRYQGEDSKIIPHKNLNHFIGEINTDHRFKQRDINSLKKFYEEQSSSIR